MDRQRYGDQHSNEVVALTEVAKHFAAGVPGCSIVVQALIGVSLVLRAGEAIAIVGGAGSGKSTLALCAAGLLAPDAGVVSWGGSRGVAEGPTCAAPTFIDARSVAKASDLSIYRGGLLVIDSADHAMPLEIRQGIRQLIAAARGCGAVLVLGRSSEACRALVAPAWLSATRPLVGGRLVSVDQAYRGAGRVAERPRMEPTSSVDRSVGAP